MVKPANAQEAFSVGEIYSIGRGTAMNPVDPDLTIGVIVNYWHQQAIPYIIDKEEFHMVRLSDIWSIV